MIKFDISKLKEVDISLIRPNSWNPKNKDTIEFDKVVRSIELKGQRLPIIVREIEGTDPQEYEIIDGEQKYRACLKLGRQKVLIYNEGIMTDEEAQELTIMFQQQVPMIEVELAKLVVKLSERPDFQLPYTPSEIETYKGMLDFDWDSQEVGTENVAMIDAKETFTFSLEKEEASIVIEALINAKGDDALEDEQALVKICNFYNLNYEK